MPGDPGATVVTNARATYSTRAAAGATGTRHSPLPSWGSATPSLGESFTTWAQCVAGRRGRILMSLRGAKRRSNLLLLSCRGMDCFASLAMTIHSPPPAEAADPVFRGVSDGSDIPRHTGYSAGACHRARRRRDPVAEDDDFI